MAHDPFERVQLVAGRVKEKCHKRCFLRPSVFMFSDMSKLDPRVIDYAATKLQAGFRGWQTRKNLKNAQ